MFYILSKKHYSDLPISYYPSFSRANVQPRLWAFQRLMQPEVDATWNDRQTAEIETEQNLNNKKYI